MKKYWMHALLLIVLVACKKEQIFQSQTDSRLASKGQVTKEASEVYAERSDKFTRIITIVNPCNNDTVDFTLYTTYDIKLTDNGTEYTVFQRVMGTGRKLHNSYVCMSYKGGTVAYLAENISPTTIGRMSYQMRCYSPGMRYLNVNEDISFIQMRDGNLNIIFSESPGSCR